MSYPTADTPVGCSSTHTPADAAFLGAVLQSIDRALAPVARRYGHDLAEDVHVALLRRLDTGRAFASAETWCDAGGVIQERAIDAWMRPAAWGEAGRALGRRGGGDPDHLPEATGSDVARAPAPVVEHPGEEVRQALVAVRRATRSTGMRPATRDLALRVLEARLRGATYAQAADGLGLRTNTAIQYVRRLLRGVPPPLVRRVDAAVGNAGGARRKVT